MDACDVWTATLIGLIAAVCTLRITHDANMAIALGAGAGFAAMLIQQLVAGIARRLRE